MKTEEKKEVNKNETEEKIVTEKCAPDEPKKGVKAWFKRQGKTVKGVIVGGAVLMGGLIVWIGKTAFEYLTNGESEESDEAADIEDIEE